MMERLSECTTAVLDRSDLVTEEEADLHRLQELVETSRVAEARALVLELAERWPTSPRVLKWAYVLEPPVVRTGSAPPFRLDREWLAINAGQYPGCWLATLGDKLLVASPSLSDVHKELARLGVKNASLHHEILLRK